MSSSGVSIFHGGSLFPDLLQSFTLSLPEPLLPYGSLLGVPQGEQALVRGVLPPLSLLATDVVECPVPGAVGVLVALLPADGAPVSFHLVDNTQHRRDGGLGGLVGGCDVELPHLVDFRETGLQPVVPEYLLFVVAFLILVLQRLLASLYDELLGALLDFRIGVYL